MCPTDAIRFVQREADEYDEAAVQKSKLNLQGEKLPCGCPGTQSKSIHKENVPSIANHTDTISSQLTQWPVQIQLAPVNAPYFDGANLLIAADCVAYAYGDFHNKFIKNRITLIGCPKLDSVEYENKLTEIIKRNNIKSVTIVRMEIPCCGGIENLSQNIMCIKGKRINVQ